MAQNKNSDSPQGFAGFDDLISDFSEDLAVPLPPKATSAKPAPAPPATHAGSQPQGFEGFNDLISEISVAEERVTPPPPPQPPVKTETRVMVEPKPVPTSLTKSAEQGSEKVLWFSLVCGFIFFIWILSSSNENQTSSSSKTPASAATQHRPTVAPSTATIRPETVHAPVAPPVTKKPQITYSRPSISAPRPVVSAEPSKPKIQYDPIIREVQEKLLSLGYSPGPADGYMGNKTRNAIRDFKQDNKLPSNTVINQQFLVILNIARPRISKKSSSNKTNKLVSKTNYDPNKCKEIREQMQLYSTKMNQSSSTIRSQKDFDDMLKYNQLYREQQKYCQSSLRTNGNK